MKLICEVCGKTWEICPLCGVEATKVGQNLGCVNEKCPVTIFKPGTEIAKRSICSNCKKNQPREEKEFDRGDNESIWRVK